MCRMKLAIQNYLTEMGKKSFPKHLPPCGVLTVGLYLTQDSTLDALQGGFWTTKSISLVVGKKIIHTIRLSLSE